MLLCLYVGVGLGVHATSCVYATGYSPNVVATNYNCIFIRSQDFNTKIIDCQISKSFYVENMSDEDLQNLVIKCDFFVRTYMSSYSYEEYSSRTASTVSWGDKSKNQISAVFSLGLQEMPEAGSKRYVSVTCSNMQFKVNGVFQTVQYNANYQPKTNSSVSTEEPSANNVINNPNIMDDYADSFSWVYFFIVVLPSVYIIAVFVVLYIVKAHNAVKKSNKLEVKKSAFTNTDDNTTVRIDKDGVEHNHENLDKEVEEYSLHESSLSESIVNVKKNAKYCKGCGQEIKPGEKVCNICGRKVK